MAEPTEDVQSSVAANAAEVLVETYYQALNVPNKRSQLTSFYIKPTAAAPLKADITLNGNIISDPSELQSLFENQIKRASYEVQCFDCQVVNTSYNIGVDERNLGPDKDGKKMSVLVLVSGSVKYTNSEGAEGETRGFTENFVLVPNMEAQNPKAPRGLKKWLIQSQTFRLVL